MKKIILLLFLSSHFFSQTSTPTSSKPKLVVGIVVDQMRNDFIYRYWNRFGNGGFKRLVNDGFYFKNTHFNYIPTFTGPGHCSIYTGATPRTHGIIANDWYDEKADRMIYCTEDPSAEGVGSSNKYGKMSPVHQLSSTIGDEMKMSDPLSKVIAVSLKDRSAILPAGHAADAAYWMDPESGNFISSNWYLKELPQWLKEHNAKSLPEKYLNAGWSMLYYPESYTASIGDANEFEDTHNAEKKNTFPYSYKTELEKKNYAVIRNTPFGNSIVKDLAIECIRKEQLGKDAHPDLFSMSFSSTDIIQHIYGPRSMEAEDTYLRLDKDLEEFLNFLDKEIGKGNYTVFLTADHGGADVPSHLKQKKIPAGNFDEKKLVKQLKNYFKEQYGDSSLLLNVSNEQVFLDETKMLNQKLNRDDVEKKLSVHLLSIDGIAEAYPSFILKFNNEEAGDALTLLRNGYNHVKSGNVAYVYKPGWMEHGNKGTTHGSGNVYDTHVPLIFYGCGIKKNSSFEPVVITQIAPTVCELIQVNRPNATTSKPLNGNFK